MTAIDTGAIRYRVIYNVATKDEVIAVCDALDAERATVRALYQFLSEWDQQDSFRDPDYRDQLQERYAGWIATAKAALEEETA